MSLLRNGTLYLTGASRVIGNLAVHGMRSISDKPGLYRHFEAGSHTVQNVTNKAGKPDGYRHPGAWLLPRKGGALRASETDLTLAVAASGALGVNLVSSIAITIGTQAIGGLIAGGVATATISLGMTAAVEAAISGVATGTITLGGTGEIGALGWLTADAEVRINGTAVPWGLGYMTATTEEAGLTPTGVANAVWAKILEAGLPAADILRILAAHAAGPATGLEGATVEFRSLDGSKARIQGTYAGGTRGLTDLDGSA